MAVDPSNSHSVASVRVLESSIIPARELLAFSRVQNHVAKNAMFIYRGDSGDDPSKILATDSEPDTKKVVEEDERGGIRTIIFNFFDTSSRT
jgi:hypothetical protein